MEIKIGSYIIRSDQYCCWIDQETVQAKGKNIGKVVTKRVTGYVSNFEQLLPNFADRKYKGEDARTVEEALKKIADAEKETLRVAREIGRKLDEKNGAD